uniref:NADH-ubiquinone oxidoreductase chain 4 n=1 Tax=Lamproblatta sp. LA male TaxID=2093468 RepID=A0A2P1H9J4_9NEOP|nr:NADH dehydrogenase subunit 4 [Lamproblatta sp. LA male]
MLKFIFFILFLIPLCFFKYCWWLIQSLFFMMMFMFLFCFSYFFCWGNLSYIFGCDYLSWGLILLSIWICVLMIMASESIFRFNYYSCYFLFIIVVLMFMLYCSFSSVDLFSFYLFFEGSLIPTFFLILGWGYQPERLQAGIYLLFYTLFASLPLLIGIMYMYTYTLYFPLMIFVEVNMYLYLCMVIAFLISMPMFLVHLWLPSAHVEAPVSGSMILAGVLLKLGGYGLLRVYVILENLQLKFNYMIISVSLVGGFLISLVCLRQTDLSALIAYSSVAHMSIVIGGIMTLNYWGICSSLCLMIAHGFCSSGLFCLSNICYERLNSRSLLINSGLMNFMPSMCLWWFLLSACNMAAPPSMNLLGEIGLLNSLIGWSWLSMFMLVFISFFSACYTLYLYSYVQHGQMFSGMFSCSLGYSREFLLLFLHWFPLIIFCLSSDYFMFWL